MTRPHAIALQHRHGGGAAPRTREACAALCDAHPGAYVWCSLPYPITPSTRGPGWEGVDDTTAPGEVAEVVAAIQCSRSERTDAQ